MPQSFSFPTANTAISQALSEAVGSNASSLTALQTTALLAKLQAINSEFVNSAHTRHQNGGWSWLEKPSNFQTKNSTTLNGGTLASATSLVLTSATDFTAVGGFWIKTAKGAVEFGTSTAKLSNTLTVPALQIAHLTGEKCQPLVPLPTDYAKARRLYINTTEYTYRRSEYLPYYRTYFDRGPYLVLPESLGTQDGTLWYERTPSFSTSGTDNTTDLAKSLDIPTDFLWYPVHKLAAHILRTRRKRDDAAVQEQMALGILDAALNYDIQRTVSNNGLMTDY